jgi:3-deoxy-manno-octulosonate cytidylyltransferase (CMP-KDO synthetase)
VRETKLSLNPDQVAIIIPARYASTRFPGKPLCSIAGVPMIEHVYKRALKSKLASSVIVATDDERIARAVEAFDGEYIMTRSDHATGTDRLAEVAMKMPQIEVIVNVQGDEPLIDPANIDKAIEPLLNDDNVKMSTLAYEMTQEHEMQNPMIVKVVLDNNGFALYFSRAAIPFYRDNTGDQIKRLGHTGLYVYRRQCLLDIAKMPVASLEQAEQLEQLRALQNGIKIKVMVAARSAPAVDVPEDVLKIEKIMSELGAVSK